MQLKEIKMKKILPHTILKEKKEEEKKIHKNRGQI